MMPAVCLNGEERTLPDGATVLDAVHATGAEGEARGVAVAVDGEVLPRGAWTSTALDEGWHLEVLHAVQGGC
jgi:sulfur carrier protein